MTLLKTIVLFAFLGFTMIFLAPLGLAVVLLSLAGLKKPMAFFIYKIAQGWACLVIKGTGCTLTVTGREHIPKKGGLCLIGNHVGVFDIVLLLALVGRPFGFIAKKELSRIPFLNIWILLLGGLFIDRKHTRKAINTINAGIRRIEEGGAMIIFPEGTRSKGRGLLPFHPGSLKLAVKSGSIAVPVAIAGSYDVLEKTGMVRAVPVMVHFAEPIDTSVLPVEERKQRLADQVYHIIETALSQ
jgi:1-acyl-sn-glycerol-3-phosphate acyltransferase